MLKIPIFFTVCFFLLAGQSWAETGQQIFDDVFWHIMTCFVLGLAAGLAIKLINRS